MTGEANGALRACAAFTGQLVNYNDPGAAKSFSLPKSAAPTVGSGAVICMSDAVRPSVENVLIVLSDPI